MASTFSDLKIQLMATGENSGTWGDVTNVNLGTAIEEAITGSANVAFSSADVTLPFINTNETQAARNLRLNLTGTSGGARNLIVPAIEKVYIINNGLADTVTVKNAAGTGIAVPTGKTMYVYNNGTNVVDAITHLTSLTTGALTSTSTTVLNGTTIPASKTLVDTDSAQTLTNKTLTSPAITTPTGIVKGDVGLGNVDNTSDATKNSATATLTNKTLTSPVVNTPNLTGGTINNASIGASTASTVASTNLSYTGTLTGGTGVVNIGSGQVFKDANGNVGIGTSSPQTPLSVVTSGLQNVISPIITSQEATVTYAGMYAVRDGAGDQRGLVFQNFTANVGLTEKVRITSSGNVGIGTSSPGAKLDVDGNSILRGNIQNFQNQFIGNSAGSSYLSDDGVFGGSIRNGGGFFITAGGTERARITSTGNVGIGTSSPVRKLDVLGDTTVAGFYRNADVGVVGAASMQVELGARSGTTSTAGGSIGAQLNNATTGELQLYSRTGGALTEKVRIDSSGNVGIGTSSPTEKLTVNGNLNLAGNGFLYSHNGGSGGQVRSGIQLDGTNTLMQFFTSQAERARIDASGNLLVGGTAYLGIGLSLSRPENGGCSSFFGGSGTGFHFRFGANNTGTIGSISTSASTTTFATSSDYRLKENVAPMTGALATVAQLNPVTYTWKADGSAGQGFIAHELQAVVPDCVTGTKDAVDKEGKPQHQGVDTSFLVATLTAALQELSAKVDTLQAELNTLKGT